MVKESSWPPTWTGRAGHGRHGVPGSQEVERPSEAGAPVADPETSSVRIRSHVTVLASCCASRRWRSQLTRQYSTADVPLASKDCDGWRWTMTTPRVPQQGIPLPRM
jgi:hypothetical protein